MYSGQWSSMSWKGRWWLYCGWVRWWGCQWCSRRQPTHHTCWVSTEYWMIEDWNFILMSLIKNSSNDVLALKVVVILLFVGEDCQCNVFHTSVMINSRRNPGQRHFTCLECNEHLYLVLCLLHDPDWSFICYKNMSLDETIDQCEQNFTKTKILFSFKERGRETERFYGCDS